MFNVILTKKDGTQYYVGSNEKLVIEYGDNDSIHYEFGDYEDAHNVELDFMESARDMYGYEIDVIQM